MPMLIFLIGAELVDRLKANGDQAYYLSEDVIGETYLRLVKKIDSYAFCWNSSC
jgi:hypothetical protein